jgi:hypothetical protein
VLPPELSYTSIWRDRSSVYIRRDPFDMGDLLFAPPALWLCSFYSPVPLLVCFPPPTSCVLLLLASPLNILLFRGMLRLRVALSLSSLS